MTFDCSFDQWRGSREENTVHGVAFQNGLCNRFLCFRLFLTNLSSSSRSFRYLCLFLSGIASGRSKLCITATASEIVQCAGLISRYPGQDCSGREGRRRSRRWKPFVLFKQWVTADRGRYTSSRLHNPVVFLLPVRLVPCCLLRHFEMRPPYRVMWSQQSRVLS